MVLGKCSRFNCRAHFRRQHVHQPAFRGIMLFNAYPSVGTLTCELYSAVRVKRGGSRPSLRDPGLFVYQKSPVQSQLTDSWIQTPNIRQCL